MHYHDTSDKTYSKFPFLKLSQNILITDTHDNNHDVLLTYAGLNAVQQNMCGLQQTNMIDSNVQCYVSVGIQWEWNIFS